MALEKINAVDAIGIDRLTGDAVLTILDSWDWSDERAHLVALQDKLNSYFNFIESGQMATSYPLAAGKKLRIDVITRFPLTERGEKLLQAANDVASQTGITLRHTTLSGAERQFAATRIPAAETEQR